MEVKLDKLEEELLSLLRDETGKSDSEIIKLSIYELYRKFMDDKLRRSYPIPMMPSPVPYHPPPVYPNPAPDWPYPGNPPVYPDEWYKITCTNTSNRYSLNKEKK